MMNYGGKMKNITKVEKIFCKFSVIVKKTGRHYCGLSQLYVPCEGTSSDRIRCPHWNKVLNG